MSIEIDWDKLTSGPDGQALAASVRDFIHDKFQQAPLPRFIRSVQVLSFEFGEQSPRIWLRDVCDPFPEFYDDDDYESEDDAGGDSSASAASRAVASHPSHLQDASVAQHMPSKVTSAPSVQTKDTSQSHKTRFRPPFGDNTNREPAAARNHPREHASPLPLLPHERSAFGLVDQITSPLLLSRSSTPGIPGGTSNMTYFHLPLSAGLPRSQTPLAAFTGGVGPQFSAIWPDSEATPALHPPPPSLVRGSAAEQGGSTLFSNPHLHRRTSSVPESALFENDDGDYEANPESSPRPSFLSAQQHQHEHQHEHQHQREQSTEHQSRRPASDPNDVQIVLQISYSGNIRLSLTAEILLDYPMPSFVGIPLKLNVTGLSFDGIALLAYLSRRAHFCFLGEEDAAVLVGSADREDDDDDNNNNNNEDGTDGGRREGSNHHHHRHHLPAQPLPPSVPGGNPQQRHQRRQKAQPGSLLREIRVESEIGLKDGGKQVLKNVGKVEKFVLEQVRRIFEEEFVFPSYWTFLV